uniref:(northern house mosquito) hypothetical protein n=1 Tax=Culex pipiens TaxID=7175 RepID=A0A8D8KCF5_CULPI
MLENGDFGNTECIHLIFSFADPMSCFGANDLSAVEQPLQRMVPTTLLWSPSTIPGMNSRSQLVDGTPLLHPDVALEKRFLKRLSDVFFGDLLQPQRVILHLIWDSS